MKLVTFLKNRGGYRAGSSHYFPIGQAQLLIDEGIAMDAYEYQDLPEEKKIKERIFSPTRSPTRRGL